MLNFLSGVALRFNTDKATPVKRKEKTMEKIINKTDFSGGTARRYKTLLADPPWQRNQTGVRGAARHYELMPLERIKAMPVQDLVEDLSLIHI